MGHEREGGRALAGSPRRAREGGRRRLGPSACAVLLAAVLLAGCGDDEGGAPAAGQTTGTTSAGTAEDGGATTTGEGDAGEEGAASRGQPASDRVLAKGALELVLTGTNSRQACGRAMTDRFLTTAYGDLTGCLKGRPKATLAAGIEVVGLSVGADRVEATVIPAGGLYDGERLEAAVVLDRGRWKVDELRADIPVGP